MKLIKKVIVLKTLSYFGIIQYHIKTFSSKISLQSMFVQSLPTRLLSSCKSLKSLTNLQQNKSLDLADLQFQICSNFLKQTKQKLYYQQAELLTFSQNFLNTVQQKATFNNVKDISASQDTTTFSFQGGDQDDAFNQSTKSMMILRKSKSTTCMRRTEIDYSAVVRQVEGKCSDRTSRTILNLIEQNKRLKEKASNIEKKEKQLKKKMQDYEKEQEQIFLLKKKSTEYDKIINSLYGQINLLKQKVKQSQNSIKRSKSPTHDIPSTFIEIQTTLKLFLNQKQHIIVESTKRLKQLYSQVQNKIEQPFSAQNDACQKCCQMLKKIKGSILKYRQLMQAEATAGQVLYQKLKTKLK